MTFEEAKEVINNITYKPSNNIHSGWLHLIKHNNHYTLSVSITGIDSDGSNNFVTARFSRILEEKQLNSYSPYGLLKLVREIIIEGELHEIDEFIKYKGIKVFDPHKKVEL